VVTDCNEIAEVIEKAWWQSPAIDGVVAARQRTVSRMGDTGDRH